MCFCAMKSLPLSDLKLPKKRRSLLRLAISIITISGGLFLFATNNYHKNSATKCLLVQADAFRYKYAKIDKNDLNYSRSSHISCSRTIPASRVSSQNDPNSRVAKNSFK